MSKKTMILGGYGIGNSGDEAILAGILIDLNLNRETTTVIAQDSEQIQFLHECKGVHVASLSFIKEFILSKRIIIGGGTIFRKNMRIRAKLIPLFALAAKILRKEVQFYSLGIDRDTDSFVRALLIPAMNWADCVSVRDKDSKEVLMSWRGKKVSIVPDPAIALKPEEPSDEIKNLIGLNSYKSIIALSLRNVPSSSKKTSELLKTIAETLNLIHNKHPSIQYIFFPFCKHKTILEENDSLIGEQLGSLLNKKVQYKTLEKELKPSELKWLVSQMDGLIAMRLHAMIFSVSTNTPLISISYSQKCNSFLEENNKSFYLLDNVTVPWLVKDLEKVLKNK